MKPKGTPKEEEALITLLHTPAIKDNLYHFVMAAYPWGKTGSILEHHDGPKAWQKQDLADLSDHILTNQQRMATGAEFGKTIIMVTHDPHSAAAASRILHLDKGKFVEAETVTAPA